LPNDATSLTFAGQTARSLRSRRSDTYNPSAKLGPGGSGGTGRINPSRSWQAREQHAATLAFSSFALIRLAIFPHSAVAGIHHGKQWDLRSNIVVPIRTTTGNPDDIVLNGWYHVAVTYNGQPGTAGNLNFYWTLMDSNRTAATLIASMQMNLNLPVGLAPNFVIGNTGRGTVARAPPRVNANFLA